MTVQTNSHRLDTPFVNMSPLLSHPKYRPDIDGLRAIAVFSVVLFHAFPSVLGGGFIGVDIFFVISGYLISIIIVGSLEKNTFSFSTFYARRIKRIFPALLLVLSGSLIFGWFSLTPDEYKQLGRHIVGGAEFISNFVLLKENGYFDSAAETKPLLHLWSLGIEEQFYFFWPLFLWFGWKRKFNLLAIIVVLAVLSFSLNVAGIYAHPIATFYSPHTRFWELMIGSILGYIAIHRNSLNPEQRYGFPLALRSIVQQHFGHQSGRSRDFQSVAGVTLIVLGLVLTDNSIAFPGWFALLPTMGTALILDAGPHAWVNRKLLANRVLVWLGLISFPLYLWHWPLLAFARILENGSISMATASCAVVMATLLAALTYRLLELPIRFGSIRRPITFILMILMLCVGLAGEWVRKMHGFETRFDNTPLIQEFTVYPHEPFHNAACDQRFPDFKSFSACLLSKDRAPTVLLLGDSHSNQYYKSLAGKLDNEAVINIAMWSCLPFASEALTFHDECNEKSAAVRDFISANKSIHTVYLAGHWAYLSAGGFGKSAMGWRQAKPLAKDQRATFIANGQKFIEHLLQTGKTVVLLRDNPDLDFNIKSCFDVRPLRFWGNLKDPCAMDKANYEMRAAPYEEALEELLMKFPTLQTFAPKATFCDNQSCWAAKSGKSLYFDGDHLSHFGADEVIEKLVRTYHFQKSPEISAQ